LRSYPGFRGKKIANSNGVAERLAWRELMTITFVITPEKA
jgi:hypothetical protein